MTYFRRVGRDQPRQAQYRVTVEHIQQDREDGNTFPAFNQLESVEPTAEEGGGGNYLLEMQSQNVYDHADQKKGDEQSNYMIEFSSRNVYYAQQ